MPVECVLQVTVSGAQKSADETSFVLVHVTGKEAPALELNLLATEESHPYKTSVRKSQINACRAKSYTRNDDEWIAVLAWVFLRQTPESCFDEFVRQVEVIATVKEGKELVLVLRQMVSGIAQRLGSITLECDESQDIELFAWAGIAAKSAIRAETASHELQLRYDSQQETIEKLNAQLQDLIKVKKRHENELLDKFRQLLNSKKAKIRDQMRLLSTAQVDAGTASQIRNSRRAARGTTSAALTRKRKAGGTTHKDELSDRDEPMADEETKLEELESDDDFERAQTPERSDDNATDDDEDITQSPAMAVRERHTGKEAKPKGSETEAPVEVAQRPPPRRELPFSKPTAAQPVARQEKVTVDDDDGETDDEL